LSGIKKKRGTKKGRFAAARERRKLPFRIQAKGGEKRVHLATQPLLRKKGGEEGEPTEGEGRNIFSDFTEGEKKRRKGQGAPLSLWRKKKKKREGRNRPNKNH